jgi:hypothetical protein
MACAYKDDLDAWLKSRWRATTAVTDIRAPVFLLFPCVSRVIPFLFPYSLVPFGRPRVSYKSSPSLFCIRSSSQTSISSISSTFLRLSSVIRHCKSHSEPHPSCLNQHCFISTLHQDISSASTSNKTIRHSSKTPQCHHQIPRKTLPT